MTATAKQRHYLLHEEDVWEPVIVGAAVLHLPLPYDGDPKHGPERGPYAEAVCGVRGAVCAPEYVLTRRDLSAYPICSRCWTD